MDELTEDKCQWFADHVLPLEGHLRRYSRRRFRIATEHALDDLIQELYARLLRVPAATINRPRQFCEMILKHIYIDWVRHASVVPIRAFLEIDDLQDETPGPERQVSAYEEFELFEKALKTLCPLDGEIFTLRRLEGLPIPEIANRVGVNVRKVEKRLAVSQTRILRILGTLGIDFPTTHRARVREDRDTAGK